MSSSSSTLSNGGTTRRDVTMNEVRAHYQERDGSWLVVKNKCYAVATYLPYHPGGINEIMRGVGKDATALFEEYHKWVNADGLLKKCLVGSMAPRDVTVRKTWPDLDTWSRVELLEPAMMMSKNFCVIRFPSPGEFRPEDGVWHIDVRAMIGGRLIEREYTPLLQPGFWMGSGGDDDDGIALVVKLYGERKRMSWFLSHAPRPIPTEMRLSFKRFAGWKQFTRIGMICIGSGITPMLQILTLELLGRGGGADDKSNCHEFWLVWGNRDDTSVCFQSALNRLVEQDSGKRLHVTHVLSRPPPAAVDNADDDNDVWNGKRIDDNMIKALMDKNRLPNCKDDGVGVLYCGTWEFERTIRSSLFLAGYESSQLSARMN